MKSKELKQKRNNTKKIKAKMSNSIKTPIEEHKEDRHMPETGTREKEPGKNNKLIIRLLNIQGLTNEKKYEIRRLFGSEEHETETLNKKIEKTALDEENNAIEIAALVETHVRNDRFTWDSRWKIHEKRRRDKEKKGGGLLILYKEDAHIMLEEESVENSDILVVKGSIGEIKVKIILVYYTTRTSSGSKEINQKITSSIKDVLERTEDDEHVMIMGDFNGHLGITGDQKIDENGKVVKELANEYNLMIANLDDKCTGEVTWERGEQRSAIDYILLNRKMFSKMEKMYIDEKQKKFDLSDHNLLEISFKLKSLKRWNSNSSRNTKYYWKLNDTTLREFTQHMESEMQQQEAITMEEFNQAMQHAAENTLKRKYTRRVNKQGEEEPPWINREIKEGIKERRRINRERRNETDERKRQYLWVKYKEKKKEVQILIKSRIYEYERQLTNEIKKDNNKMWQNIKKLKNERRNNELKLHNEDGIEMKESDKAKVIVEYWSTIYKMHNNDIEKVWNEQEKEEYDKEQDTNNIVRHWIECPPEMNEQGVTTMEEFRYPLQIREHIDMVMKTENHIKKMERVKFEEKEVKEAMLKLKNGKAAGPDGLKGELYKELANSELCIAKLTECFNTVLESETVPEEWKKSRTVLLEKKRRATVRDLRPLALTNISYKIYMALIKVKIEDHIEMNREKLETQAGFTKGARVEDNLAILQYLREDAQRKKEELVITGIDFCKAYDSIKRHKIIETLMYYRIDKKIISTIAKLYQEDRVQIQAGNETLNDEIRPTSGIRQGCTLSATLFKLITYRIIKEMDEITNGYNTGKITIKSLFFADDGLLVNINEEDAANAITQLQRIASKYGLSINKDKSNVLWINPRERRDDIEGIKVVSEIKYLGITISDNKDMFKKHKENKLKLAEKLSNITHSVMIKSCNRLLIGKAYWKHVAVPAILYGSSVINWTEKELNRLQILQNHTCRRILNAPKWATNSGLKGEIGISSMASRITQSRLSYISSRNKNGNELIKLVINELETNKGKWKTYSEKQYTKMGIKSEEIYNKNKKEIKEDIYKKDTELWKREMASKKSLEYYRIYKKEVKQEEEYENNRNADLWFRSRTNCLYLSDRNKSDKRCKLCGDEVEDIEHFLLECIYLEETRRESTYLQRPRRESNRETIMTFLYSDEHTEHRRIVNEKLWTKRNALMKDLETNEETAGRTCDPVSTTDRSESLSLPCPISFPQ